MSTAARSALGLRGEALAAEHLERLGFAILHRRYRTRFGELDLVACDGTALVFCEVKTRRGPRGRPWDGLGPAKQAQVRRMAGVYLREVPDRPRVPIVRCDAIGVLLDGQDRLVRLEHVEAAF
jgi:putative endonuclease